MGLSDKIVLVTGGNRGIGAEVVNLLRSLGAQVAYTYRSTPHLNDDNRQDRVLALPADVTNPDAMAAVAENIEQKLGPIYGVVANAGITRDNFLPKLSSEDWDAVIDTNLKGIYNTLKPLMPQLYERREGAVVCISSISGVRGNLGQTNYAASKAGVIGLTKALALEAARYGVRANAIAPGFIESDMTAAIPEKVREKIHR